MVVTAADGAASPVWDSGRVQTSTAWIDSTITIGTTLIPDTAYRWKVRRSAGVVGASRVPLPVGFCAVPGALCCPGFLLRARYELPAGAEPLVLAPSYLGAGPAVVSRHRGHHHGPE